MDGLLLVACRTLDAYTVEGAGDPGRSPTDRRSFGPGARTETHASRPEALSLPLVRPSGPGVGDGRSILSPPPSPHPRLGEGGGERMLGRRTRRRWASGTRPAAWSVRAARKNA